MDHNIRWRCGNSFDKMALRKQFDKMADNTGHGFISLGKKKGRGGGSD